MPCTHGFLRAHAHLGQRGSEERRARHGHAVGAAALPGADELIPDDAVVVQGDVGELRAAVDVAHRVHALRARAQLIIDRHEAPVVGLDAGCLQVQVGGGRGAACSHQHGIGLDLAVGQLQHEGLAVLPDLLHPGALPHDDAGLREHLVHRLRHDRLGAAQEMLAGIQHGDLGAEVLEHLGELQSDEPAADDRQALRQGIRVLDGRRVVDPRQIDAGDVRARGHGTGAQHDRLRGDDQLAVGRVHRDLPRADEPSGSVHQLCLALEHPVVGRIELADQRVAPGHSLREVLLRIILRAAPLRRDDQILGGNAGDVDAGAAVHLRALLHHGHGPAGRGPALGERLARLAPADHQQFDGQL